MQPSGADWTDSEWLKLQLHSFDCCEYVAQQRDSNPQQIETSGVWALNRGCMWYKIILK